MGSTGSFAYDYDYDEDDDRKDDEELEDDYEFENDEYSHLSIHDINMLSNGYIREQEKQLSLFMVIPVNVIEFINNIIITYRSKYIINLFGGTTDPFELTEFVLNAIKRIPKENHVAKIKELFKYSKDLNASSYKLILARQKFGDKKNCVVKQLNRKYKVNAQSFLREVVILESLKHENILDLYGIYLDKSSYFIVTAYCSGGHFFDDILKNQKGVTCSEEQTLKHIKPILSAINFMHSKGIVHRDLKPSNMIFDKKGKNKKLKIVDFATAEIVIDEELYYGQDNVGNRLYRPPEWKAKRIGSHIKKWDIWSFGCIVYVLIAGRIPFFEWKYIESYNNDLSFPKGLKTKLSCHCVDFILKLLEKCPKKRLSAKEALNHPWIAKL